MICFKIFTLFPNIFPSTLGVSVPARALKNNLVKLEIINISDFATDKYKTVDEYPFGGGAGMLMKPDVLSAAIESELKKETEKPLIILTSARGFTLNQKIARDISYLYNTARSIYIICGRFEGVDERLIEYYNMVEINLGKFVLFGGEVAALAIIESIIRMIPNVLGNEETHNEESYSIETEFENLMEYPQYTKPKAWNEMEVPEVLVSGNHKKIKEWRLAKAKEITRKYETSNFKI